MTKEKYIRWVAPRIVLDSLERNLLPSPRIAQALFESAFGTSELAVNANNLFGVKNNDQWEGRCYSKATKECYDGVTLEDVTADFRAYNSWEESITDQGDYLVNRCTTPKYHPELKHYAELIGNRDYRDCARILKEKNYGTSPEYDLRVIHYVELYNLTEYDSMTAEQARATISEDNQPEEKEEKKGMKIILTVGHSILKNGACTSADGRPFGGILEYSYNKNIVDRVAAYLRDAGHTVDVLVCPELEFSRSTDEKTYKLSRVNNGGYDLAVELHLNASNLHNARGCEVLYKTESGRKIAQQIQNRLATVFKNRGIQKRTNLYMLNSTRPTTIMLETFFCDNSADCALAEKTDVARLIAEGIHGGQISQSPDKPSEPAPSGILYRVQTGAFRNRKNAEKLKADLEKKGFDAFITAADVDGLIYRVQVGAFSNKSNATAMVIRLKSAGFDAFITS